MLRQISLVLLALAVTDAALAAASGQTTVPPAAFVEMARQENPDLVHFGGFQRIPIQGDFSLDILVAGQRDGPGDNRVFASTICLAISEQNQPILYLGDLSRKSELNYQIDSVDAGQVTFLAMDPDYGFWRKKVKIYFDIQKRERLGRKELRSASITSIACVDNVAWCAGAALSDIESSRNAPKAYLYRIGLDTAATELVTTIGGSSIERPDRIEIVDGRAHFVGPLTTYVRDGEGWQTIDTDAEPSNRIKVDLIDPDCIGPAEIDIRDGFASAAIPAGNRVVVAQGGVVVVDPDGAPTEYPVQPFEDALLRQIRHDPQIVNNPEYQFELQNFIGAWQHVGSEIIFGTDFYDGEGSAGIGALGVFNLETRIYHYEFIDELAPWSTAAILVEDDTVWFSLQDRPEGMDCSNGILEYNRTTKRVRRYPIPHITHAIARCGDTIIAGTMDGIYLIHPAGTTRIGATVALDGSPTLYSTTPIQADIRPIDYYIQVPPKE